MAIAQDVIPDTSKNPAWNIRDVPKNILSCQCANMVDKNSTCDCTFVGCPVTAPLVCMQYVFHCVDANLFAAADSDPMCVANADMTPLMDWISALEQ